MKTGEQIRAYLLDFVANAMLRPAMYHGSPESMEECFMLVDNVLAQITGDEFGLYGEYLMERGYGAARFTDPSRAVGAAGLDERFGEFGRFFATYMNTSANYRRDATPDSKGAGDV